MKINKISKRILSVILSLLMIITSVFVSYAIDDTNVSVNPNAAPSFANKEEYGLFAHAAPGESSTEAWQKWENFGGMNSNSNVKYLFLPYNSSSNQVELYNNYPDNITVKGTVIKPYTAEIINYTHGETIKVDRTSKSYNLIIYKSDAEASVYINDTTGSYIDCNGNVVNKDFYSFLISNKENSVKGSSCSIVGENGIQDTKLKKIKGRGNTNWKNSNKKPFNITFDAMTTIGSLTNKKFSMISSAMDSTFLRNKVMYDLSDEVGAPYTPNLRYVDFYINGIYKGCFLLSKKVDLGKNALVSLKDTSDTVDTNFNFLVEVDVWNYADDVYFVSDKGYHVVLKTPDLDGYTDSDPSLSAKYNYIKDTYQKLEDALYKGTMADLEKICDIESLALMYLIQEFGKNCDGGYTSTYFTYNADEGKFYACPVWDFDSTLGAVDCYRDGCSTSTCYYKGWTTRDATYNGSTNPLGRPFEIRGTTNDGKTFLDICKTLWKERFIPAMSVLLGSGTAKGNLLKSVDEYKNSVKNAVYNNYIMWNFQWYCSDRNSGLTTYYTKDYDGEVSYMKDWIYARYNWMSEQFNSNPVTSSSTLPTESTAPKNEITVYYANTLNWENVNFFVWKSNNYWVDNITAWPGVPAEYVGLDSNGVEIYKATFDSQYNSIIFNDTFRNQTVDIQLRQGINLYAAKPDEYYMQGATKVFYVSEDIYREDFKLGDVNLDGQVNINDATLLQRYLVDIETFDDRQKAVADTNKDENITIRDVTTIQLYLAQVIKEL